MIDVSQLEPHQQRVFHECSELRDKISKLADFLFSLSAQALDKEEEDRMHRQLAAMCQYRRILHERLNAFRTKDEPLLLTEIKRSPAPTFLDARFGRPAINLPATQDWINPLCQAGTPPQCVVDSTYVAPAKSVSIHTASILGGTGQLSQ